MFTQVLQILYVHMFPHFPHNLVDFVENDQSIQINLNQTYGFYSPLSTNGGLGVPPQSSSIDRLDFPF